jgi:hypothetical protein
MKTLFFFLIAGAVVYGIARYVPAETKRNILGSSGLSRFFNETLPGFLRKKLSIPENPTEKRRRLADELTASITNVKRELDNLPKDGANKLDLSPARAREISDKIEKAKEFLAASQAVVAELSKSSSDEGVLIKTAGRVIDEILPAASPQSSPVCQPSPR